VSGCVSFGSLSTGVLVVSAAAFGECRCVMRAVRTTSESIGIFLHK